MKEASKKRKKEVDTKKLFRPDLSLTSVGLNKTPKYYWTKKSSSFDEKLKHLDQRSLLDLNFLTFKFTFRFTFLPGLIAKHTRHLPTSFMFELCECTKELKEVKNWKKKPCNHTTASKNNLLYSLHVFGEKLHDCERDNKNQYTYTHHTHVGACVSSVCVWVC